MVEKLNARLESRQKSSQNGGDDIHTIDASQIPEGATEISDSLMFHNMGVKWTREESNGD